MAMTKKEKAEFDAAIQRANTLAALRWTEPVARDVPIPEYGASTTGWDFNSYNSSITQKWSEPHTHGDGPARKDRYSGSQNGVHLFSTKLLALRALRHAVEREAAEKLRKIDEAIKEESAVES